MTTFQKFVKNGGHLAEVCTLRVLVCYLVAKWNHFCYRVSTEDKNQRLRADFLIWHNRLFIRSQMHSNTQNLRQIADVKSHHLNRLSVEAGGTPAQCFISTFYLYFFKTRFFIFLIHVSGYIFVTNNVRNITDLQNSFVLNEIRCLRHVEPFYFAF